MTTETFKLKKLKHQYERFPDERIAQLAHDPDGLTPEARELLLAEIERRRMQVFCELLSVEELTSETKRNRWKGFRSTAAVLLFFSAVHVAMLLGMQSRQGRVEVDLSSPLFWGRLSFY